MKKYIKEDEPFKITNAGDKINAYRKLNKFFNQGKDAEEIKTIIVALDQAGDKDATRLRDVLLDLRLWTKRIGF